ncbi:MAG: DUF975 family protein [Kiritimatiellae bacterium]|nr:DUF975 family protein [Kiritimatiellia bacterium]
MTGYDTCDSADIPSSKDLRDEAWSALEDRGYWPFVGAGIVLMLISGFFSIPFFSTVVTMQWMRDLADVKGPHTDLPAFVLALALTAVPLLYIIGLGTFSDAKMSLAAIRREMRFELFWSGYGHGWKTLGLLLVMLFYILLWSLLLVVPGIKKAFSYAMAPYILVEHPDWSIKKCIAVSSTMMKGSRLRLCDLLLSFLVWFVLAVLASRVRVIGHFVNAFYMPYPQTAVAAFYEDLKRRFRM